jgi:hypothetical protein
MNMSIDTSKSYATEKNLMKALTKLGLAGRHPMVVRNREGRWTAIFSVSLGRFEGNIAMAARLGFKTFA